MRLTAGAIGYRLSAVGWLVAIGEAASGSTFGLDDVAFWVGGGENRAGIALDWDGDDQGLAGSPSLAWGFRWDGDATAEGALRAVLAEDDRLVAKLDAFPGLGAAVIGLGYDLNNDGAFAITPGVSFVDGVTTDGPADGSIAVDPADAYREGFLISGFWVLSTAAGPLAEGFADTPFGVSGTTLAPNGWIGLAFSPTFDFAAAPNNLVAAEPPGDAVAGDFNRDGSVDAADYTVWRDTLLDADLYLAWRDNFGATPAAPNSVAAPEPTTASIALIALALMLARGGVCRTNKSISAEPRPTGSDAGYRSCIAP